MGKRVCVTGATGFMGSHLVASLKADGYWVRGVDHQEHPERRHLYEQADDFSLMDLRQHPALYGCDWIYHLAADHGGAGYFHSEHDQPAARNNMQIDLNVLRVAELAGVERLFYASSFCAYPVGRQDSPNPLSEAELYEGVPERCYGAEKRFMTQLCEAGNLDARAGVFATIYGPYQESDGIRAKFPTAITKRALESERGEPISLWGDGTQVRTFLYVDDAVTRIRRVMEVGRYEGPVNIASDQAVTVKQCADWACEFAGVEPVYDLQPNMPTGVTARVPDLTKYASLYGGASQVSAREGFRRLNAWMRERKVAV